MKTVTHLILTFMLAASSNIYAQYNSVEYEKKPAPLQIVQIDYTGISTLIFIKYTNKGSGWINIGDKTHLKDTKTDKVYYMLNSINIPLSDEGEPKVHILDKEDQVHYFCLEFEKLPETVEKFNLIEEETNPNAFNFFGVTIHKDKKTEFVNIDDFIKSTPVKEYGYSLKDGNLIYYYKHKGMSISMTLFRDNSYGDYYQAWINIQNFTGKNLLLAPNRITAKSFMKKAEEMKDLNILSYEEYMKKVKRKQNWQNFAVAFSNGLAASNAGYSYSTTNTSVTGVTNSYGSASGYVGDTYGYASGWSSSYSTAYGRSTTQSYNGAAAYAAQQNANAQTNAYISNQYQIKSRLSEGYIKANTLANQTEFMGYFNIQFIKTDNLRIEIPINGETYVFTRSWSNKK
ncbi:hypothetical protein [Sphingobacterium lumbrici]|uniref:hypothetical protein n=1 Tax=Sphingobacterium lumbrici TaxID=2559600 RepID=UPI00112966AE|nr:hypothetical protein [Sphingobacterium lumbrici]